MSQRGKYIVWKDESSGYIRSSSKITGSGIWNVFVHICFWVHGKYDSLFIFFSCLTSKKSHLLCAREEYHCLRLQMPDIYQICAWALKTQIFMGKVVGRREDNKEIQDEIKTNLQCWRSWQEQNPDQHSADADLWLVAGNYKSVILLHRKRTKCWRSGFHIFTISRITHQHHS